MPEFNENSVYLEWNVFYFLCATLRLVSYTESVEELPGVRLTFVITFLRLEGLDADESLSEFYLIGRRRRRDMCEALGRRPSANGRRTLVDAVICILSRSQLPDKSSFSLNDLGRL